MLKNITIKNFRSIKEISIELPSNYIVLTGENNTGKTNILRYLSSTQEYNYIHLSPFISTDIKNCANIKDTKIVEVLNELIYTYNTREVTILENNPSVDYLLERAYSNYGGSTRANRDFHMAMELKEQHPTIETTKIEETGPSLSEQGYGIQKSILLTAILEEVYRIYQSEKDTYLFNSPIIIGIDEPENSLHPKLQIEMAQLLQDPKYGFITFIVATHSYHFLNYTNPDSNFLVYKEGNETKIKNGNFDEIAEALGYPYPIDKDVWESIFKTDKNIFIVEGKTDKAHVENCIKLFPELVPLFERYEILLLSGVDNIVGVLHTCKHFRKTTRGFFDNDDKGRKYLNSSENFYTIPSSCDTDIEKYTGATREWYDSKDELLEIKEQRKQAIDADDEKQLSSLHKRAKGLKKSLWKAHLTDLTNNKSEEAKKHYENLKDFLIKTVFQKTC